MPGDQHDVTELNSALPQGTVLRRRLLDLVSQGLQRPLTLVSAPAGFGKTVLLASWEVLSAASGTVTHITMDVTGEQVDDFMESALEAQQMAVDGEAGVLVLDCGDFTITPELGDNLHRLIRGCSGRLRVVLLTRTDPPLPLHRYRLEGALAEIRAADLAFTVEETTALMQGQKLSLTPAEVADLQALTDGWPAGLMFAAMSLAGNADTKAAIREFRGDSGNVAAYLMTEVLDAQPSELRDFLLRTCIVDELQPALAEALTGRTCDRRLLEFMSHGNSFIQPVPGTDGCYRYQSLFRQFLRNQLSFEEPDLDPVLHRAAAGWFAQNGERLAAIRHAISAQQWGDAARYLVDDLDIGRLLAGRQRRLLELLFADLPDDLDGAEVAVVRAALALTEFDAALCASELSKARTYLGQDTPRGAHACEIAITLLQAVSASLGKDVDAGLDAVLAAEGAIRAASPGSITAHPELRMLVAGSKGRVLLQRGDFEAALDALTDGIAVAEAAGGEEALAELLGMAALVEAVWGHLRQSAQIAAQVAALADSGGTGVGEPQSAIVAQAWTRADQGDLTTARDLVHRADEAEATYDTRVLAAASALVRARLLRAGGDVDLASAELQAARNSYGAREADWLGQSLAVDQAKILVARRLPREAMSVIERSNGRKQVGSLLVLQRAAIEVGETVPALPPPLPAQRGTVPLEALVDGWLVQAAHSIKVGDPGRGRLCLERALRLAAPERLRRPFFEAPPAVRGLLRPSGDLVARHPWLRAPGPTPGGDHAAGRSGEQSADAGLDGAARPMPLTSKEQEVLEHLAELLTTDEIAKTMFVSVNTVRSHVRSILRKLGASRRNEAVRRAWELGLLPSRPAA
jgi:LuxR family maltose regulon positive regulatory protein